jgi:hypothetical protein
MRAHDAVERLLTIAGLRTRESEHAEGFTERPKRRVEFLHSPLASPLAMVDLLLNVADQTAPK